MFIQSWKQIPVKFLQYETIACCLTHFAHDTIPWRTGTTLEPASRSPRWPDGPPCVAASNLSFFETMPNYFGLFWPKKPCLTYYHCRSPVWTISSYTHKQKQRYSFWSHSILPKFIIIMNESCVIFFKEFQNETKNCSILAAVERFVSDTSGTIGSGRQGASYSRAFWTCSNRNYQGFGFNKLSVIHTRLFVFENTFNSLNVLRKHTCRYSVHNKISIWFNWTSYKVISGVEIKISSKRIQKIDE